MPRLRSRARCAGRRPRSGRGEPVSGRQAALDDGCAQLFVQLDLLWPGIVGIEEELHLPILTRDALGLVETVGVWLCLAVHLRPRFGP